LKIIAGVMEKAAELAVISKCRCTDAKAADNWEAAH
jgi:hypothetical protein